MAASANFTTYSQNQVKINKEEHSRRVTTSDFSIFRVNPVPYITEGMGI